MAVQIHMISGAVPSNFTRNRGTYHTHTYMSSTVSLHLKRNGVGVGSVSHLVRECAVDEGFGPGFRCKPGGGWCDGRKVSSLAAAVALPPCSLPYRLTDQRHKLTGNVQFLFVFSSIPSVFLPGTDEQNMMRALPSINCPWVALRVASPRA